MKVHRNDLNTHMKNGGMTLVKLHTISEVAKMLGLSSETIRYYESQGVIKPIRGEKNGYRYYGGWDIHMLTRARMYLLYGFTMEETASLLGHQNSKDVIADLSQQENVLEQEIILKVNQLRRIRQEQENIQCISKDMGKYQIKKNPAIYRLSMQDGYIAKPEKEIREMVAKWMNKAPFLFSTALFRLEDIQSSTKTFSFGLGIEEEYANLLGIGSSKYVEYIPSQMCVYTVVPSRSTLALNADCLFDTFNWMEKQNLKIEGDILTRVVLMLRPDEEYFNWHQVWIPIAKIPYNLVMG